MKGFKYERYDYSFLYQGKENFWPKAVKIAAKTIGFDLVETKPLNEPIGKLYWLDYTYSPTTTISNWNTATSNATVSYSTSSVNSIINNFSTGPTNIPITVSNYNDFTNVYTR